MANLIRRNQGQEPATTAGAWDPFRLMRDMLRWDPYRELDTVFGQAVERSFAPTFEVKETKDAYVFRADLPGVKDADLEISLTGNRLSISGRREQERHEQGDTFYASERAYGSFTRSFTLPEGIDGDNVSADLKNGVLTLSVPKKPEVQPRKVTINTTAPAATRAASRRKPERRERPLRDGARFHRGSPRQVWAAVFLSEAPGDPEPVRRSAERDGRRVRTAR